MRGTKGIFTVWIAALAIGLAGTAAAKGKDKGWTQIDLSGPIETQLPDGSMRTLHPSCSGGPVVTETGIRPGNTDYFFFVKKGNPNRLLITLNGGGACWDAATCIGSPLTDLSTYTVELDETPGRLADAEGIFDTSNPENPYKNYTQIFVPYCSADIHWGSKDTNYVLQTPAGPLPWTIHHRGTDNFLAAMDWLQKNGRKAYGIDFARARDVTVAGPSAGGYGANLAFTYVAELTGKARLNLIADASIGVQTRDFYTTAIYNPDDPGSESWGVLDNLPSWVPGLDEGLLAQGAAFPNGFVPSVFAVLSDYKPDAHLASLTSNLDEVQIFFYGLQKGEFPPSIPTAVEWYFTMDQMLDQTATLPNYRFFIDDGTFHTFIGSDEQVYGVGANGISLADWITQMIKPGRRNWENLDAGAPF